MAALYLLGRGLGERKGLLSWQRGEELSEEGGEEGSVGERGRGKSEQAPCKGGAHGGIQSPTPFTRTRIRTRMRSRVRTHARKCTHAHRNRRAYLHKPAPRALRGPWWVLPHPGGILGILSASPFPGPEQPRQREKQGRVSGL